MNHRAFYPLKDEVALATVPPFERVRCIAFLFSHTSVLLILLILTSNHFWSQHHLLEEFGNPFWTSINFGHLNHKTGNLFVQKQNSTCQCYHSRRLGKSLRTPLSQCPAIPGCADCLGFLTERILDPPPTDIVLPIDFPGLCIHQLSFTLNPKVSWEGRETRPCFILTYQRTFNTTKITTFFGFSK